jgi:cytochrome P450
MIFRGTDTTAILTEWIMAEMVLHPEIQRKVQHELDAVLGKSVVATSFESKLPQLPYLQAVIKETLRLHPPGPLLSWARLSTQDVCVAGHTIPAGTTAMVNMWAITHDPEVWANPDAFTPERFLNGHDVDVRGNDLRLAPFGAGRRVCPGRALGLATVQLWVAQLLHNFNWTAAPSTSVDLTEVLKLSSEMVSPLQSVASRRLVSVV